jgi:uncharacterized protein
MKTITHILNQKKFKTIAQIAKKILQNNDPAHDFSHCLRVLRNALTISKIESGNLDVLVAASFLHDICNFPKDHPQRKLSSTYSAKKAEEIMHKLTFSKQTIEITKNAILHHSFSRGSIPHILESRIFQDADRLDSIGAIGIARAYTTGAKFNALLYATKDPFLKTKRILNDKNNTLDHFFIKLLKLKHMMLTPTGKKIAHERTIFMQDFIKKLETEV